MSLEKHREHAAALTQIRCAIITVSDSRTLDTDLSGKLLHDLVEEAGFEVSMRTVVPDDPKTIQDIIRREARTADALLLTGGTGISERDNTIPALQGLLQEELPGFGELFRILSYGRIGSAAMLSRAAGGVYQGSLVFAMPGSPGGVKLAMEKLILPELPHLVAELKKGTG